MGDTTLDEAKAWLRDRVDDGAECPCCTQFAKVYRRKLNAGMAKSLIRMYQAAGTDWQNITETIPARSREEGKLRYWGLVEPGTERGIWRVTPKGELFVKNRIKVPRHVRIYDDRMLGFDGPEETDIVGALRSPFDYDELMKRGGSV